MVKDPILPIFPEQRPQVIHLVKDLPPRPSNFKGLCDWINPMPDKIRPKGSPRKTEYLGSAEWSWSPMHSRIDAYYLNPRRSNWLLWVRFLDDNQCPFAWVWVLYAYGPKKGVNPKEAAVYLLMDAWEAERKESELDHYHWLNETDFLSVAEFSAIGRAVWPKNLHEE